MKEIFLNSIRCAPAILRKRASSDRSRLSLHLLKIGLILVLLPSPAVFAQGTALDDLWEEANQAYTGGEYPEAIQLYDSIRHQGYASAKLYYNMGNAYYKDNQIGQAILYYNKAQRLDPGSDDIRHNLTIANTYVRDRIDSVPEFFLKTWARQMMYWFSSDTWAILGLVFFGVALGLVLLYLLGGRMGHRKAGFYGAIVFLLLSIGSLVYSSIQRRKIIHPDEAVIMITAAPVKAEPNAASRDVFVLHEGTKVRVVNELGDWREISISDGNRGWIELKSIALID